MPGPDLDLPAPVGYLHPRLLGPFQGHHILSQLEINEYITLTMISISQIMNKERELNTFISAKRAQGISDTFLPLTNARSENSSTVRKYFGYPSFRKEEEKPENRMKSFEEYQIFFRRVPRCVIQIDDNIEVDPVWYDAMLQLYESTYAFDQRYWKNYEWDQLWAHAFSEDGHLPMIWD